MQHRGFWRAPSPRRRRSGGFPLGRPARTRFRLLERAGHGALEADFRLNRQRLRFARAPAYIGGMDDVTYWTEKLRQAEQELDAARTRSAVDEAAARYQRAKADLKRLEADRAAPKRRTNRGRASAASSS